MKKAAILIAIVISVLILGLLVTLWLNGNLFLRLSNATVTANGIISDKNQVYKSGNETYLIFTEGTEFKTFLVFSNNKKVGTPTKEVPSSYSKSLKTTFFVLCLDCQAVIAGTDKLDQNAKINFSSNKISFQIYNDNVVINF